jgi:hypothetical protein
LFPEDAPSLQARIFIAKATMIAVLRVALVRFIQAPCGWDFSAGQRAPGVNGLALAERSAVSKRLPYLKCQPGMFFVSKSSARRKIPGEILW